ncbi:SDR family oxidoreductase [Candidatus Curtissbacteria bacterium]|nr:SDR family oxidoreductase [Candidatus Curtissbacteria bacterium]
MMSLVGKMSDSTFPKSIAVLGPESLVGSRFCDMAENNFRLIKTDKNKLDILNGPALSAFFSKNHFDYIILFAAFTDVDLAEKEKGNKEKLCWKLNVEAPQNIAKLSKEHNRKLIFISTDFVFDGQAGPYNESDKPGGNPEKISWYGQTKLEAEKILSGILDDLITVRISFPYRANFPQKLDFARNILAKYLEGTLYPLYSDQKITPTFVDDLFPALDIVLKSKETGIFHVASSSVTTPYDFAKLLLEKFENKPVKITEGSLKETMKKESIAPRPVSGGLVSRRISSLGFQPTDWKDGIGKLLSQNTQN